MEQLGHDVDQVCDAHQTHLHIHRGFSWWSHRRPSGWSYVQSKRPRQSL